jgi:hypothetical protein
VRDLIKGRGLIAVAFNDFEEDVGKFEHFERLLVRATLNRAMSSKRKVRCESKERACTNAMNAMLKRITNHLSLLFCIL